MRSRIDVALLSMLVWLSFVSFAFASDITGVVHDALGNPVADVQITCRDLSGKPVAQATTNDDGQYCITGLAPGTYSCSAIPPGGAAPQAGSAALTLSQQGLTE